MDDETGVSLFSIITVCRFYGEYLTKNTQQLKTAQKLGCREWCYVQYGLEWKKYMKKYAIVRTERLANEWYAGGPPAEEERIGVTRMRRSNNSVVGGAQGGWIA